MKLQNYLIIALKKLWATLEEAEMVNQFDDTLEIGQPEATVECHKSVSTLDIKLVNCSKLAIFIKRRFA